MLSREERTTRRIINSKKFREKKEYESSHNVYYKIPREVIKLSENITNQDYTPMICVEHLARTWKWRNEDKEIQYTKKNGEFTINHFKDIHFKTIRQPRGYYCEDCLYKQYETENYALMHEDGDPVKFWTQCKDCKTSSSRSRAARSWTEVLRTVDGTKELKNMRFATFTMKNPSYDLQDIWDPLGITWLLEKDDQLKKYMNNFTRTFWKDGKKYHKYIGDTSFLDHEITKYRKKLKLRLKNMRHKKSNFRKNVSGGLVAYECTVNICPIEKKLFLNPHLHLILHGKYYDQRELQEDWGLGIVDIQPVKDTWKLQLEIAKYVGKDGSRRTTWGSLREIKRQLKNHRNDT